MTSRAVVQQIKASDVQSDGILWQVMASHFADLKPCITAFCAVDTGGRKLKTYPYTNNYAHLLNGASVHMPQSTYYGGFCASQPHQEI
jgi:hypothetical protein